MHPIHLTCCRSVISMLNGCCYRWCYSGGACPVYAGGHEHVRAVPGGGSNGSEPGGRRQQRGFGPAGQLVVALSPGRCCGAGSAVQPGPAAQRRFIAISLLLSFSMEVRLHAEGQASATILLVPAVKAPNAPPAVEPRIQRYTTGKKACADACRSLHTVQLIICLLTP